MIRIACYSDCIYKNYPDSWPCMLPVKPEIGDKIMERKGDAVGVIIDIIYREDGNGNVYAHIELAMER